MSHLSLAHPEEYRWMEVALEQARLAAALGEIPVGAVVVVDNAIAGVGKNAPIGTHDPTAHAEIMALRNAAANQANYRLTGATLITTVEPCLMCLGAMVHARIGRLVFGAEDPKVGATKIIDELLDGPALNHRFEIVGGVLAEAAVAELRSFFERRRSNRTESAD